MIHCTRSISYFGNPVCLGVSLLNFLCSHTNQIEANIACIFTDKGICFGSGEGIKELNHSHVHRTGTGTFNPLHVWCMRKENWGI